MALTCEARVKITLSLGLIILVVSCAVITVVVLKATTDDPDLSSNPKYDSNVTNVTTTKIVPIPTLTTLKKTTNQNGEAFEFQKSSFAINSTSTSQSKYISSTTGAIKIEEITFTGILCKLDLLII